MDTEQIAADFYDLTTGTYAERKVRLAEAVQRSAEVNARLSAARDARRHALLYPGGGPSQLRGDDLRH